MSGGGKPGLGGGGKPGLSGGGKPGLGAGGKPGPGAGARTREFSGTGGDVTETKVTPGPGRATRPLVTLSDLVADGHTHVLDGAMGTLLYARGYFVNVCYDELSRTEPGLVEAVHREYLGVGAEVLETNTFGANPVKLSGFGLEEHTEEINRQAAEVARRAANGRASVVGALGPLGIRLEPWGPTSVEEAEAYFRRQAEGLAAGGVDGFILETFSDLNEIRRALAAVRSVSDLPVIAQMTIGDDGRTQYGTEPEQIVEALVEAGASVIGLNCSVGPATILEAVERMARVTDLPLSAQPNAGLPRTVGDRKIYLASPEYMGQYARRMKDAGVRFVGGCCGTTPEHIRRIRIAVGEDARKGAVIPGPVPSPAPAEPVNAGVPPGTIQGSEAARLPGPGHPAPRTAGETLPPEGEEYRSAAPVPLERRSRLGARLAGGHPVTTVELAPPSGWNAEPMLGPARQLRDAGVDAVAVLDTPRGRARMGVLPAALLLARETGIQPLVHYTCRDRTMPAMISDLLGAAAGGLRNFLLVSGDPAPSGVHPDGRASFDIDSIGLTNVISTLNRGMDPSGNPLEEPTEFVVAVALNQGSADRERERQRFRWKVEAGADFAVTQPVFDPEDLLRMLESVEGGSIPVVAGLWPPVSLRNAEFLANEVPGVRVPADVLRTMEEAEREGPEAAARAGVRIAVEAYRQVQDVVGGAHLSVPSGRLDLALEVLRRLDLLAGGKEG